MKKTVLLSLAASLWLGAAETQLKPIQVEATTIDDVDGSDVQSADLAAALSHEVPSITMIRRSGIANDVIFRGQKRDNINVTIDDAKVCGACPNRMDPPTSHVVTNNIQSIEVVEGPYDVENFGTLSGGLRVTTKAPAKDFHGQIDLNAGSWGQEKASATFTGGNDTVRLLLSASAEKSGQYVDGDGNTLAEQIDNYVKDRPAIAGNKFADPYRDMDAYNKKSMMGKAYINLGENHLIKLGATVNISKDILYPSSPMDAIKDDSYIYDAEYRATNLGSFSKELSLSAYHSHVWHPMSNAYRMSAVKMNTIMSNELTTAMEGAKIKNTMELGANTELKVGVDASRRNWDGDYKKNGTVVGTSITDTDTDNIGVFAEAAHEFDALHVSYGLRFDTTSVTPEKYTRMAGINSGMDPWQSNDYQAISANLQATYALNDALKLFGGVGKGHRVPDARELYILGKPGTDMSQTQLGTPDLDATTNYQADLGVEATDSSSTLKGKFFYNRLYDYIYYNATKMGGNMFENIDATIYGFELSGSIYLSDAASVDMGFAYQIGEKDEALAGQSDKDLADIPPLQARVAYIYEYAYESRLKIEGLAADRWHNFDADNGEQEIDAYGIINVKLDHRFNSGIGLAVGIDNLTDETYAVANTYKDLTLITGSPTDDVMLINEPGRYFYANLSYHF